MDTTNTSMINYQCAHCNDNADYYDAECNTFFCGDVCQSEFYTFSGNYHGGESDENIDYAFRAGKLAMVHMIRLTISIPKNNPSLYSTYTFNTTTGNSSSHESGYPKIRLVGAENNSFIFKMDFAGRMKIVKKDKKGEFVKTSKAVTGNRDATYIKFTPKMIQNGNAKFYVLYNYVNDGVKVPFEIPIVLEP